MYNHSPKPVIAAILCFLALMITVSCMQPVDLDKFQKDLEELEKVVLGEGSDSGLEAGNGKITGLDPNKYYLIEERNKDGQYPKIEFVKSDGSRSDNFNDIGRVTGREITGLTNFFNYTVWSAKLPEWTLWLFDGPVGGTPAGSIGAVSITSEIIIDAPQAGYSYFLQLPSIINSPTLTTEIIKFSHPSNTSIPVSYILSRNIELEVENTITDYVFLGKTNGKIDTSKFNVLKIIILGKSNINVNVTYNDTGGVDKTPLIDYTVGSYSHAKGDFTIDLSVSNAGNFNSFRWFKNGEPVGTNSSSYSIIFDETTYIDNKIKGKHFVVVSVRHTNGLWYSAEIEIEVTP